MTDHNPLTSLHDIKDVGRRLTRWTLNLQRFNFTWEHQPGKHHCNADVFPPTCPVLAIFQQLSPNIDIKTAQCTDDILSPSISALSNKSAPPADIGPGFRHATLEDGILCRMFRSSSSTDGHLQVIIPEALKGLSYSSSTTNLAISDFIKP